MAAILAIYFGMWIYLFVRDDSSFGNKFFRFTVFFFTGWFGSILYFFLVYKQQFSRRPTA